MQNIKVDIEQWNIQWEIVFTKNIFQSIKEEIKDYQSKTFLFAIDSRVFELYEDYIMEWISDLNVYTIIIPHWEENKNMDNVFKIIDKLMEKSLTRKDYVVALWGGVIWDITWFASSLFKRWTKLIQVPTTLLSMFDSSVWGKTGVDYMWVKNGIGTFYSADLVLVDNKFLKTLEDKEILWWFFEGLKHSILQSKEEFDGFVQILEYLWQSPYNEKIDEIICQNIQCKLNVVQSDPMETIGKRRILNYGHTFWHALETYLNFQLWHGICVGFGIIYANLLAYNLWFLDKNTYQEIDTFVKNTLKDIKIKELDFQEIYSYMLNDKKNEDQEVNFILLKEFWNVFEYKANREDLKNAFDLFVKQVVNDWN